MTDEALIIARREIRLKIRSKAVGISTLILIAIAAISPWLSRSDPKPTSSSVANQNYSIALFAIVLLYTILSLSGSFLAFTIIEEKSGRVMEVLLTSISPRQLLLGKIAGVLTFSLAQLIAVIAIWMVSTSIAGTPAIEGITAMQMTYFLLWFFPAVISFSFIYSGMGALISRSEDAGAIQGPISLLLIGSTYLAAYSFSNPTSQIVQVATYLPPLNFSLGLGQLLVTGELTQAITLGYLLAIIFTALTIYLALAAFENNLLYFGKFSIKRFLKNRKGHTVATQ
jgi:ABC-2 type transport system permease protein